MLHRCEGESWTGCVLRIQITLKLLLWLRHVMPTCSIQVQTDLSLWLLGFEVKSRDCHMCKLGIDYLNQMPPLVIQTFILHKFFVDFHTFFLLPLSHFVSENDSGSCCIHPELVECIICSKFAFSVMLYYVNSFSALQTEWLCSPPD